MANASVYWKKLTRYVGTAILLLSIAITTANSASHQLEMESIGLDPVSVVTTQTAFALDEVLESEDSDYSYCPDGFLCHSQPVLQSTSFRVKVRHLLSGTVRPDSGISLTGRSTDVEIPPPLRERA